MVLLHRCRSYEIKVLICVWNIVPGKQYSCIEIKNHSQTNIFTKCLCHASATHYSIKTGRYVRKIVSNDAVLFYLYTLYASSLFHSLFIETKIKPPNYTRNSIYLITSLLHTIYTFVHLPTYMQIRKYYVFQQRRWQQGTHCSTLWVLVQFN